MQSFDKAHGDVARHNALDYEMRQSAVHSSHMSQERVLAGVPQIAAGT